MPKMVSLRLDEELLEWADGYAAKRGVSRSELLAQGLRSFREDCESGVPDLRRLVKQAIEPNGVGSCPKNAKGHVWGSDVRRCCVHCSRPGRDMEGQRGGFLGEATAARAELFSRLRFPASANGTPRKS